MVDTANIAELIEPSLGAMGYRLVRDVLTSGRGATLQIMAERCDEAPMTVDDCAEISRSLSVLLDVANPIAGSYTLEVSSPGIERPLTRPRDYERFAGCAARIELQRPIDGRKRFRGRLAGLSEGSIRLALAEGEILLPLDAVLRAKLLVEDGAAPARRSPSRQGLARPRAH